MAGFRLRVTVQSLVGFTLGGSLVGAFVIWNFRAGPAGPRISSIFVFACICFAGGALAGVVTAWRVLPAWRTAIGFGIGFPVAWFGSMFVMMSLQGGGSVEYGFAAVGFGVSFAVAGTIAVLAASPRHTLFGVLAFGLAGAVVGPAAFRLATHSQLIGLTQATPDAAWVIGGALFGAALDMLGTKPEMRNPAVKSPRPYKMKSAPRYVRTSFPATRMATAMMSV
ncbi:MAG: hypothetical protein J7M19_00715 [Planctomycetes bacterium]|nr:hypothetical protein [Planctomycetota bacterium]